MTPRPTSPSPSPSPSPATHPRRQRGVTLIELMVGLAIGLFATLVITQITTLWEGRKRTTSGGSDAQVNGALALQQLQRDVQMAGYGSIINGGVGCWARVKLGSNPRVDFRLAPVVITNGANGATDSVRVLTSNARSYSVPTFTKTDHARSANSFAPQDGVTIGNQLGDLMIAVPTRNVTTDICTVGASPTVYASVFNISAAPTTTSIAHATGSTGPWNHDETDPIFPGATAAAISYSAGTSLMNLGNLDTSRGIPLYRDYQINTQTLQTLTYTARGSTTAATVGPPATLAASATTVTEDVAPQIVNLQAVYGHDTSAPRDNIVDTWDTTAPTSQDGWSRVIAVRIAIVARSTQYEQDAVTPAKPGDCSSLTAASNFPKWKPDGSTWDCLDVSGLTDYQHYRYRVFETVIPLRNMLWQS